MSLLSRLYRGTRFEPVAALVPSVTGDGDGHPALASPSSHRTQRAPALVPTCSNRNCRSGWLHLWRNRTSPVFEGGWTCSTACVRERLAAAIARELDGCSAAVGAYHHRLPIGLVLLEQGKITSGQLRRALEAQRAAASGRLGDWLVRHKAVSEQDVTRALALQWSCPVLTLEQFAPGASAAVMPRLFIDAFAALPLRIAAGRVLYLGFAQSLDPILALATERMTGLRVESGIVRESAFAPAHARLLQSDFPSVTLIEAVSQEAAAQALAQSLERCKPIESRLVRVHDCLWLRLWLRPQTGAVPAIGSIRDVLCSVGPIES